MLTAVPCCKQASGLLRRFQDDTVLGAAASCGMAAGKVRTDGKLHATEEAMQADQEAPILPSAALALARGDGQSVAIDANVMAGPLGTVGRLSCFLADVAKNPFQQPLLGLVVPAACCLLTAASIWLVLSCKWRSGGRLCGSGLSALTQVTPSPADCKCLLSRS